ncbi:MAG: hypothetical protein J0M00_26990 [Burkholderiales bacterium]|nr:hypothetical protein [Burkholderiales bacterium]
MHRLVLRVLALPLITLSFSAMAVVSAQSRLSNLSFELVDLDVGDGISPSLILPEPGLQGEANIDGWRQSTGPLTGFSAEYLLTSSIAGVTAQSAAAAGVASVSGLVEGGTTGHFHSSFTMFNLTPIRPPGCFFIQCPPPTWVYHVKLSPRTSLRITGDIELRTQINPGDARQEQAIAYMVMDMLNWHSPSIGSFRIGSRSANYAADEGSFLSGPMTGSDDQQVSFEFMARNQSSDVWSGEFALWMYAIGHSRDWPPTPPIPEVGTVALFLLGLAVLPMRSRLVLIRRRDRRFRRTDCLARSLDS